MRQRYKDINFRGDTLLLVNTMNEIISDYMHQGYVLTVRQLYYQLVARDIVPNTEQSYKRITGIVNDARLGGMMDWDAIEDRTREFIRRSRWKSGRQILEGCASQFHMDMWGNQENRVFVIVEKEALAGVLERVCRKYDVPLLAARGYPSGTVLREFVEQDVLPAIYHGQYVKILHLGDHDPSGIDMTRDLRERIQMFAGEGVDEEIDLIRIALTMEQIEDQNPPPNPAKTTDARFMDYRRKFGSESWELDALTPQYLNDLVSSHVADYFDRDKWQIKQDEIEEVKGRINEVAKEF